jgi:YegS/Rv2252/BmrU family lipid kinase
LKPEHLVINPCAGKGACGRLAPVVAEEFARLGAEVQLHTPATAEETLELIRHLSASGVEHIAVAGGDGTIFAAVNGIMAAGGHTALGIVPAGTGNDFVKMLDLDHDWRGACARIVRGEIRRVDVGRCNEFYFANGVGIGLDAQVAMEANAIRWLRGDAVYVAALLRTLLFRHSTPRVHIRHDHGELEHTITMVAAANGRCYGGTFNVAPHARLDDGQLQLLVADGRSRTAILGLVPAVMRGRHEDKAGVTMVSTRRVVVDSDAGLPVHADGEIIYREAHHLEIEVLPSALKLTV